MSPIDDAELLRRGARERSEAAFAALVEQHLGAIYCGHRGGRGGFDRRRWGVTAALLSLFTMSRIKIDVVSVLLLAVAKSIGVELRAFPIAVTCSNVAEKLYLFYPMERQKFE